MPTIDAYTPREIARKVEALGVTKARSETLSVLVLAVLAGAFIALGALFFTVVVTRPMLGFGISRLVGALPLAWGLSWSRSAVPSCSRATIWWRWRGPHAALPRPS